MPHIVQRAGFIAHVCNNWTTVVKVVLAVSWLCWLLMPCSQCAVLMQLHRCLTLVALVIIVANLLNV